MEITTTNDNKKQQEGRQKQERSHRRLRVLLGISGSVSAIKGPELAIRLVKELHVNVRIVLTKGGQYFWIRARTYDPYHWTMVQQKVSLQKQQHKHKQEQSTHKHKHDDTVIVQQQEITTDDDEEDEGTIRIYTANEEWKEENTNDEGWNTIGDDVLHITLRNWADVCVVAPLSANTLGKVANGLCDDTLSCILRAWDYGHTMSQRRRAKPLLLAPAMNTAMYDHPLTKCQLDTVRSFFVTVDTTTTTTTTTVGHESHTTASSTNTNTTNTKDDSMCIIVEPQEKTLACGEVGTGALASIDDILEAVKAKLDTSLMEVLE